MEAFPDGIYFVPLAALTDPTLVPSAIATALGLREDGTTPVRDHLQAFLATKQLLLVVDNVEHVVEAASGIGDLLRGAPDLTVLATSRAPLHLQAEREYPVPPLALPQRQPPPSPEQLSQYEAVRLFIARAQAVKPDFTVDNANAPAVAEICHRLDGLPLAIELAAARVRMLPPRALLARLEQRLPVLTGGARDAPARQQTLRATIAWSHDLLSGEEQTLFRRLSTFAGGFAFEAAEAVANSDGDTDVFAGVTALVDHSLVQPAEGVGGEPHYTMLETMREFGLEQLAAYGEADEARARHAAYFVALAAEAELHLLGVSDDQAGWMARMDADFGNLRGAIAWLLAAGDGTRALQLLIGLQGYVAVRYFAAEARQWVEAALAMAPDAPAPVRAAALFGLIDRAWLVSDHAAALAAAEETLKLAQTTDDPLVIGRAHFGVGNAWELRPDVERAAAAYARTVPYLRQTDRPGFLALALAYLGDALHLSGDLAAAQPLLDEALLMSAPLDDPWGHTVVLSKRAHLARTQGDHALAVRLYGEALAEARTLGNERQIMYQVAGLAGVALATGQAERAARLLGAVAASQEATGFGSILSDLNTRQAPEMARAALGEEAFMAAWEAGRAMPWPDAVADALAVRERRTSAAADAGATRPPRHRRSASR